MICRSTAVKRFLKKLKVFRKTAVVEVACPALSVLSVTNLAMASKMSTVAWHGMLLLLRLRQGVSILPKDVFSIQLEIARLQFVKQLCCRVFPSVTSSGLRTAKLLLPA